MTTIFCYKKITTKELEKIFKNTVKDISAWFVENPKRRVCRASWVYGEHFKVRKNYVKEDVEKMYQKTILDTFKS